MTPTNLSNYREFLMEKLAELSAVVRNREAIAIEKNADALDEVQNAAERELAIQNLDRGSQMLRNVRGALERIDDGTLGVCVRCEGEISPRRLAAVPWTPYCIECQEWADRQLCPEDDAVLFEGEPATVSSAARG